MGAEPLLWTADVVARSSRRALAIGDGDARTPGRDVLTALDARAGQTLNMTQLQDSSQQGTAQPVQAVGR